MEMNEQKVEKQLGTGLQTHLGEKTGGNGSQTIYWPFTKPINGTTVDKRWKHAKSCSKCITKWAHTYHHMKVFAALVHKEHVHFQSRSIPPGLLCSGPYDFKQSHNFIFCIQVGYLHFKSSMLKYFFEEVTESIYVEDKKFTCN